MGTNHGGSILDAGHPRWGVNIPRRSTIRPEGGYKHADPNFVHFVGPDLGKISDAEIVTHALVLLDVRMRDKPIGECGIPVIDNITPGDDDLGAYLGKAE